LLIWARFTRATLLQSKWPVIRVCFPQKNATKEVITNRFQHPRLCWNPDLGKLRSKGGHIANMRLLLNHHCLSPQLAHSQKKEHRTQ
jgi:hypothetical protein